MKKKCQPHRVYITLLRKRGITLIEAMLAMFILLVVMLCGAAFIYYSSARIAIEGNKRVAIEVANSRLEEMRLSGFSAIAPVEDENTHNIKKSGENWVIDGADDEMVDINGVNFPISTTLQYVDAEGDSPINSFDYLSVVVSVCYRLGTNERVRLLTYIGSYR